jgi:hypothetical protein
MFVIVLLYCAVLCKQRLSDGSTLSHLQGNLPSVKNQGSETARRSVLGLHNFAGLVTVFLWADVGHGPPVGVCSLTRRWLTNLARLWA